MARHIFDRERLASDLASLEHLGLEELRGRWLELYGRPAPAGFRTHFLIQCLGFKLQERVLGGLKPATRRELARMSDNGRMAPVARQRPSGTVLIREWHGKCTRCMCWTMASASRDVAMRHCRL